MKVARGMFLLAMTLVASLPWCCCMAGTAAEHVAPCCAEASHPTGGESPCSPSHPCDCETGRDTATVPAVAELEGKVSWERTASGFPASSRVAFSAPDRASADCAVWDLPPPAVPPLSAHQRCALLSLYLS